MCRVFAFTFDSQVGQTTGVRKGLLTSPRCKTHLRFNAEEHSGAGNPFIQILQSSLLPPSAETTSPVHEGREVPSGRSTGGGPITPELPRSGRQVVTASCKSLSFLQAETCAEAVISVCHPDVGATQSKDKRLLSQKARVTAACRKRLCPGNGLP